MHLIANRICAYLKIKSDPVLIDWACSKIKSAKGEQDVPAHIILEKLSMNPGLTYAEVARTAYKAGYQTLASQLLDYEPRAADKVVLLLGMDQDRQALQRAVDVSDADLVFFVLFHLRKKYPLGDFFRMVNDHPLACNLLVAYAKQQDHDLLRDFYYQDDRRMAAFNMTLMESFNVQDVEERIAKLQASTKFISKSNTFEAKCHEEHLKLLKIQQGLEKDVNATFVGTSLTETLYKLFTMADATRANKIAKDFKVVDKKLWWTTIRAYVDSRNYRDLETFSNSKKSPIGYQPFYSECVRTNQPSEAAKYISRCDKATQPYLYMKVGAYRDAAQQAFTNKDRNMLLDILAKCAPNDASLANQIELWISQLKK